MPPHEPVFWDLSSNNHFRCVPNTDVVGKGTGLPIQIAALKTSYLYNRAVYCYLQGLIARSRYGADASVETCQRSYIQMHKYLTDGYAELQKVDGLEQFYADRKVLSLAKTEHAIVFAAKMNFDTLSNEHPDWFQLRTPEWHQRQQEKREYKEKEDERLRTAAKRPKISYATLDPRVLAKFRAFAEQAEESIGKPTVSSSNI